MSACVFVACFRCLLYTPCMLWVAFQAPFLYIFVLLPIKKKKYSLREPSHQTSQGNGLFENLMEIVLERT